MRERVPTARSLHSTQGILSQSVYFLSAAWVFFLLLLLVMACCVASPPAWAGMAMRQRSAATEDGLHGRGGILDLRWSRPRRRHGRLLSSEQCRAGGGGQKSGRLCLLPPPKKGMKPRPDREERDGGGEHYIRSEADA